MNRPKFELADVIGRFGAQFSFEGRLNSYQQRVLNAWHFAGHQHWAAIKTNAIVVVKSVQAITVAATGIAQSAKVQNRHFGSKN